MPARKFTDEQEQEICRRYAEDRESTVRLANDCGVSSTCIGDVLKRFGVKARSLKEAKSGLTHQQEAEICERYQSGESAPLLGEAFGVNATTICKTLKQHGVRVRSNSEAHGGLARNQAIEVCRRYQAGESTMQLAREFGLGDATVGRLLRREGIKMRNAKEAQGGLSDDQEREVCRRYAAGDNTAQLGAAFGVASVTVSNILKRGNIKARSSREAQGGLTDEREAEVCARYQSGESIPQLSKAFGPSVSTIGNILKRNNVTSRSMREAMGGLDDEQEAEACARYQAGENGYQLGAVFGVSPATIGNILKRHGIERRTPVGFGDSAQHVIDGTGLHANARECEFYLFELARYSGTHCKPGIAFDAADRVRQGNGEYGAEILRLVFATRAEAYFLEQAVLDATRGSADCPDDLWDWNGFSEIRAMPAEDMVPTVLRLADELEELGMWEFAARYVPMTAAQRAICQQRALIAQEVR
jgi:DNA-directed RNA polymerase specialized sigma24 family protein